MSSRLSQSLSDKENGADNDGGDVWREIADAFAWGLSCGSASCMNSANSVFDLDDAVALYNRVEFMEI